jgi:hypothetical protein
MEIWAGKTAGAGDVCCVCGCAGGLTRHHVVPACYREPLHHDRDYHDLHDIVFVCLGCHEEYEEKHARRLRRELCERHRAPMMGRGWVLPPGREAVKAAAALSRHGARIPAPRAAELRAVVASHLGREPREEDISMLAEAGWQPERGPEYASHGELVVAKIKDMRAFWRMWRLHFASRMRPRFLPPGWDPDREVRWSPDRCRRRRGKNCPCREALRRTG